MIRGTNQHQGPADVGGPQASRARCHTSLTSSATKKRKMMRPRFATLLKTGIDSVGKMDLIACQVEPKYGYFESRHTL